MRVDGRSFTLSHSEYTGLGERIDAVIILSGCDTQLAKEQQSCQLPNCGNSEKRSEAMDGVATFLDRYLKTVTWTENSLEQQQHSMKLLTGADSSKAKLRHLSQTH